MSEASTPEESADRGSETAGTPTVRGWQKRVAAAGLPAETAALVAATVKATKLRRPEKLAVADELIAHFHDADRQGVTPEAARADFGDPSVAARLIRRAKKRNRGILSRAWTAAKWCFLGFVVFYAALALRFYSGEPEVKVDYLAKLNATAAAVPEDERAWPEIRAALDAMGFVGDRRPVELGPMPGEAGWKPQRMFLAQHAESVRVLREARARSGLGHVVRLPAGEASSSLVLNIDAWIKPLGPIRVAARLLAADALAGADRGDAEEAAASLGGVFDLADMLRETPTLLNFLVVQSIRSLGIGTAAEIVALRPDLLSEMQLATLQTRLSAASGLASADLQGESAFFHDLLQRLYTDDGSGGGRLTPAGVFHFAGLVQMPQNAPSTPGPGAGTLGWIQRAGAPAALLLWPDRAAYAAAHDNLLAAAEADLMRADAGIRTPALDAVVASYEREPVRAARFGLVSTSAPALASAVQSAARGGAAASAAVLALHRHRLAEGEFPAPSTGYAELVPAYLDAIPLDPLHGTPMRWTLRDAAPVIYSLGADGDDDGGVAPLDNLGGNTAAFAPPEEAVDGDWIAWPPG